MTNDPSIFNLRILITLPPSRFFPYPSHATAFNFFALAGQEPLKIYGSGCDRFLVAVRTWWRQSLGRTCCHHQGRCEGKERFGRCQKSRGTLHTVLFLSFPRLREAESWKCPQIFGDKDQAFVSPQQSLGLGRMWLRDVIPAAEQLKNHGFGSQGIPTLNISVPTMTGISPGSLFSYISPQECGPGQLVWQICFCFIVYW